MNIKIMWPLLIISALLACLAFSAEAKKYDLENDFASATLIVDGNNVEGEIYSASHCGDYIGNSPSNILCVDGLDYTFSGTKDSVSFGGQTLACNEACNQYEFRPAEGTIDITYDGKLHMIIHPSSGRTRDFTFSISEDPFTS